VFVVPGRSPFEGDLQDIRRLPARAIEELQRARIEEIAVSGLARTG
jgi:hypothetical protein